MNLLNKPWFILYLIIPLFRPYIIPFLPYDTFLGFQFSLHDVFNIWRIISVISIILIFCFRGKINRFVVAKFSLLLVIFISTLLNGGDLFRFFILATLVAGVGLLINLYSPNPVMFMKVLFWYLGLLVVANLGTVLLFEDGISQEVLGIYLWDIYLLGHRNSMVSILLFIVLIGAIYPYIVKGRLSVWSYVVFACALIAQLILWSATGVASIILLITLILLIDRGIFKSILRFSVLFPVNIGLFFAIVVFRAQERFDFIFNLLNRQVDFTGRTALWDYAWDLIVQAPFFGYGFTEHSLVLYRFFFRAHSHNQVLEILLRGGFLALIAYITIIVFAGISLKKYKGNPISSLLSAGIFVFLIAALMRYGFEEIHMMAIFALAFNVDKLVKAHDAVSNVESGAAGQTESTILVNQ